MEKNLKSSQSFINRSREYFVHHSFSFFIFVVYFLIAYSLYLNPALADFDDTGAGARAVGMGGAFTALADDPFGIYYNPAGLGFIRQSQIGADYGKLFVGMDDNSDLNTSFVSAVFPIFITESGKIIINKYPKDEKIKKVKKARVPVDSNKKAKEKLLLLLNADKSAKKDISFSTMSITAAFAALSSSRAAVPQEGNTLKDKTVIRHFGTFALGWRNFALTDYYQESAYYLSFGKSYKERLSYGLNVKFLSEKYKIDDYLMQSPVFDYGKKDTVTNYSVDAGLIYNILPRLFFGISASDINQPDLGLKEVDQLLATYRVGLAWRQKSIKWAIDGINNADKSYTAFGVEKWFDDVFALRGGLKMGGNDYVNSGAGFSINLSGTQIDYAFQMPLVGLKDMQGSHRVSMVYRFGGRPKEDLEAGSLELSYANQKDEVAILKKNLSDVRSEKKKLEEELIEESAVRARENIKAAESDAKKPHVEEILQRSITPSSPGPAPIPENISVKKADVDNSIQLLEVKPVPVAAEPAKPKEIKKNTAKTPKKTAEKTGPKTHIVKPGENLQSIAQKYYNDTSRWKDIYKANKDKVIGGQVAPGQELVIP